MLRLSAFGACFVFSECKKKNKKKSVEGDDFDCVVPSVESDIVIREFGGMFFFSVA